MIRTYCNEENEFAHTCNERYGQCVDCERSYNLLLKKEFDEALKNIERLTTALRDIKKQQEFVLKSSALFSQPWIIANEALGF